MKAVIDLRRCLQIWFVKGDRRGHWRRTWGASSAACYPTASVSPVLRKPPPAVCGIGGPSFVDSMGVAGGWWWWRRWWWGGWLCRISPSQYKQCSAAQWLSKMVVGSTHAYTAALSERPRLLSSRSLAHVEILHQDARLIHGDVPRDLTHVRSTSCRLQNYVCAIKTETSWIFLHHV